MTRKRIYLLLVLAFLRAGVSFANEPMVQVEDSIQKCQRIDSLFYLGQSFPHEHNQDSLIRYCNMAIDMMGEEEYFSCLAKVYLAKGKAVFANFGPRDEATRTLLKALHIYTSLDDSEGISSSNLQLGVVNYDMEQYQIATSYFEKILKSSAKGSQLYNVAEYLLALSYSELHHFERATAMFEGTSLRYGALNAVNKMRVQVFKGKMLINQGRPEEAIALFQSIVIPRNDLLFRPTELIPLYSYMSTAYLQLQNYPKSIQYGKLAYHAASNNGASVIYLREVEMNLHLAYKAMEKYDSAYFYLNSLNDLNNSVANNQVAQRIAELSGKFESDQARNRIEAERKMEKNQARMKEIILLVIAIMVSLFAILFFYQKAKIKTEKRRSDHLLLNILPVKIAEELKETGAAQAQQFDSVSILFSDFVSFTAQSAQMSAGDLVKEIHAYFMEFDAIMEKHKIEKIKTIGDAYMAVGGIPEPSADSVKRSILAGLEMQSFVIKRKAEQASQGKTGFEMRVGIHTGPVVAGIVGNKKFQYDIWGDSVNTASRMESCGQVEKVNISQETYLMVEHEPRFVFENRGMIEVKGKGKMQMWFVSLKS